MKNLLLRATTTLVFCAYAAVSSAQSVAGRADFSHPDISQIIETRKTNAIRFERDYKGRTFDGNMVLEKIVQTSDKGVYRISFKTSPILNLFGFGGRIDCILSDPKSLKVVANWETGNLWGRTVEVSGIIKDASLDLLVLSNVRIRSVGGTAFERGLNIPCE